MEGKPRKTGGRPKGARNRLSADMRMSIEKFINFNWEQAQKDFDRMPPQDRWTVLLKLLPFTTPQLRSIEASVLVDQKIDRMTPAQVEALINQMLIEDGGQDNG